MQSTMTKMSGAVAYTTLASTDIDRAERFYRDTLGFDVERIASSPGSLMIHCGKGTGLSIYERAIAPNCDTTAATFIVEHIEAVMTDLRANGVVFEEFDLPYLKTNDGIASQGVTKASWFKDPDGNTLSLVQM
jgi:catechol 2,3-dioxygenase-like lactoylglutathione lyase family enzyme